MPSLQIMSREVILPAVYTATSATRHAASQMADKVRDLPGGCDCHRDIFIA
jgi:hypothetical protein